MTLFAEQVSGLQLFLAVVVGSFCVMGFSALILGLAKWIQGKS
jgi:hypothetical protein